MTTGAQKSAGTPEEEFLAYRRSQEASVVAAIGDRRDLMASMLSIELNTTELCNRTCVFCPRVNPEIYPNRNLNMTCVIAEKIGKDLARFDFKGRISFSGFGEPVLNKSLVELVSIIRRHRPSNIIDTNTNGDRLTVDMLKRLFDAGLSAIYVNMYDGPEQEPKFRSIFEAAGIESYKLRPHWKGAESSYGLILNNRSGLVQEGPAGVIVDEPNVHPCYYPFSRAMIDWNGDMLLCTNDWGRKIVIGSVMERTIEQLWLSDKMRQIRERLSRGDRSFAPCSGCNVDGTLSGKFGFDLLMSHYRMALVD